MKIIVNGSSMEPTMFEGETYKVLPIDPETLKPRDIVVAKINGEIVVKRITAIYALAVDLKGDNWGASKDFDLVSKKKIKLKVIRPTIWTRLLRRYNNVKTIKTKEK